MRMDNRHGSGTEAAKQMRLTRKHKLSCSWAAPRLRYSFKRLRWLTLVTGLGLVLTSGRLAAQPVHDPPQAKASKRAEISVLAGLIQPIVLRGGNLEVDVVIRRFVIGYSHGFRLNLQGSTVVGDASDQGLAFELPFSTGLGLGYRLTNWLDLRGEVKWHRFEVRYDDASVADGDNLFSYDTITVGAGIYGHWRPFRNRRNWTRGLTAATSVRLWPNIHSTLDGDERVYENAVTGRQETHRAANIGIANTPLIVNVSVGYAFQL